MQKGKEKGCLLLTRVSWLHLEGKVQGKMRRGGSEVTGQRHTARTKCTAVDV